MPTQQSHEAQAQHNEDLANKLLIDGQFNDWVCTTSFYSALHFFEAFLARYPGRCKHPNAQGPIEHSETSRPLGLNVSPHTWRENVISANFSIQVYRDYHQLRQSSEMARYHTNAPSQNASSHYFFTPSDVQQILNTRLQHFKAVLNY